LGELGRIQIRVVSEGEGVRCIRRASLGGSRFHSLLLFPSSLLSDLLSSPGARLSLAALGAVSSVRLSADYWRLEG
jgi:hypothetical protein